MINCECTKNKLFNYRPLLSMCLFFIAGIVFIVGIFNRNTLNIILSFVMIVGLIVTIVIRILYTKHMKLFKILSVLIAFIVGVVSSLSFILSYNNRFNFDGEFYITGRVCERSYMTEKGKVVLTLDNVKATSIKTKEVVSPDCKVRLYLEENDERASFLNVGENIVVTAELVNVDLFDKERNNYSLYNKKIYVLGFGYEENLTSFGTFDKTISDKFKEKVKENLDTFMTEDYSELAYTMLFGDKAGLDEGMKESFSLSGIGHLLAVSGLHVGFIVTLLMCLLSLFKANTSVKFWVISLIVFIYAFLCDFTVSVTRAFLMTVVLLYSKMRMFKYDGLSSLSFAGLIILLFNPFAIFDAGFQLSFLAVAGIIVLAPKFTEFFSKYFNDRFAGTLSVCLSAQIGTIPVMMMTFSNLSIFSIITNLLCIPIASVAFMVLFVFVIISLIIPVFGMFTYLFEFLMRIVAGISSLTGAINLAGMSGEFIKLFSILMIATCIVTSEYLFFKPKTKKWLTASMVILTISSFVGIFIF